MRGEQPDQTHKLEVNEQEPDRTAEREVRKRLSELREYLQTLPQSSPQRDELFRLLQDALSLVDQSLPSAPSGQAEGEGAISEALINRRWMESEHTLRKEMRAEIKDRLESRDDSDKDP